MKWHDGKKKSQAVGETFRLQTEKGDQEGVTGAETRPGCGQSGRNIRHGKQVRLWPESGCG